jgi:hypothetical protein
MQIRVILSQQAKNLGCREPAAMVGQDSASSFLRMTRQLSAAPGEEKG